MNQTIEMTRYFIYISYKGTNYHGWQVQNNAVSVQELINNALSILLKHEVKTVGAGRTDTGVHAKNYVAHFDSKVDNLDNNSKFLHSMNRILPHDIVIHRIRKVKPDANARFDATLRGYEYVISRSKDPFLLGLSWQYDAKLNIENMQLAAQQLFNYTDFTSFSKVGSDNKTNNCEIYKADWLVKGNILMFKIEANRFLRNMVRAIVGTLIDVGRGKITPEEFAQIIEHRDRKLAGTSAPAEGLFFTKVEYPEKVFY
ncbi:MAG: tRNA pseudouridine38-40 synthase [Tenuifilum sp.]|nr:tRNA pseudouridine38-40 synthase [Tenuifilum sp.]